jgi:hypothetical protein
MWLCGSFYTKCSVKLAISKTQRLGIAELGLEQDRQRKEKQAREKERILFFLQKRKYHEEEYVLRDQAL